MAKKQSENKRVDDGMEFILEKIDDPEFIKAFGHYIKYDNSIIVPKYQDILYSKTGALDIQTLIEEQKEYLKDKGFPVTGEAVYFLVPVSAVIALPSGYHSNRVYMKEDETTIDKIMSISLITGAQNHGKDDDGDELFAGICFCLLGYRITSKIKDEDIGNIYVESVNYLNDFITAYKIFRHDHTVNNVTPRTLPGRVDYYIEKTGIISPKKIVRIHDNDIADVWSKRLPFKEEMDEISSLVVFLPSNKIAHYALRIAERAITNMCLGQYEDCILNADRFAELALRDILQQELYLTAAQMRKYQNLWSKKYPKKAVIQVLANEFKINNNAILDKWLKNSRTARNNIVHGLDIKSITPNVAFKALQYNMFLIHLMASKSTKDFNWYKQPPNTFSILFMDGKPLS